MSIGENLRQLRLEKGLTQAQVAEKVGLTRQALSSYESGRTRPDVQMLLVLCEIYETDLDGILYGRSQALQALRRLRRAAAGLLAVLLTLTLISSSLLFCANRFFPLEEGPQAAGASAVFEAHIRLTQAWETIDGLILALAFIGFLVLLVLKWAWKCRVSLKQRLLYVAALGAGLLMLPLPFALSDPVFPPVNYCMTPRLGILYMLFFFGLDLGAELLRAWGARRRHKK